MDLDDLREVVPHHIMAPVPPARQGIAVQAVKGAVANQHPMAHRAGAHLRVEERGHQQSQAEGFNEEVRLEREAVVRSSPPRQPLCCAMGTTATDQPCSMVLTSVAQEPPVQLLPSPPLPPASRPSEDARPIVAEGSWILTRPGRAFLPIHIVPMMAGSDGPPCRHPINEIITGGVCLDVLGDRLAARLALRGTPLSSVASEPEAPQVRWKGANDGQVGIHGCPGDAGDRRVHPAVELLQRLPHELRLSHTLQVARAGVHALLEEDESRLGVDVRQRRERPPHGLDLAAERRAAIAFRPHGVPQYLDPHIGDIEARGSEEFAWYGRDAARLYKNFTTGGLQGQCCGPHNIGAGFDRGGKCQIRDVGIDVVSVSDHASGEGTVGAIPNGQDLCLQALEHGLNAQAEEHHGQGAALADPCLALTNEHPRGEVEL